MTLFGDEAAIAIGMEVATLLLAILKRDVLEVLLEPGPLFLRFEEKLLHWMHVAMSAAGITVAVAFTVAGPILLAIAIAGRTRRSGRLEGNRGIGQDLYGFG